MIYPIRFYGDPILRRRASQVTAFDAELSELAADMLQTMYAADGVGLAAPQIGVPLRLFVALELEPEQELDLSEEMEAEERRRRWEARVEHVVVNPVITHRSGSQAGRDGCLSLPGLSAEDVPRDLVIELAYQDLTGAARSLRAEGYFAHVLQHEYDHLEGVLFFDHLEDERRLSFLEEHRSELAELQREAKQFLKRERERTTRSGARGRVPVR